MLKKVTAFALAVCMLFAAACSDDNSTDTSKAETTKSASEVTEDSSSEAEMSKSESSEKDNSSVSETTTTTEATTTADDSSAAEKTTTMTKATAGGESSSTTTKSTSASSSYVPPKTTTTTTKKVTTTTTTTTTKKTTTTTAASNKKPSNLTRLESAVWDISLDYSININNYRNNKNLAIIREELIKYGQTYCKKAGVPKYYVNSKMYPYYDKNGKPLYAADDMYGNTIAVGSNVEFPYDEHFGASAYSNTSERLSEVRAFINGMYLYIERVICNSMRHGIENIPWNITYGYESTGIAWTVMSGFPEDWPK